MQDTSAPPAALTRATFENGRHSLTVDIANYVLVIDGQSHPLEDCSTKAKYCFNSGSDFALVLPKFCGNEPGGYVQNFIEMRVGGVVPHHSAATYFVAGRPFGFQYNYVGGGVEAIWYAPELAPGSPAPWHGDAVQYDNWLPLTDDGAIFPCKLRTDGSDR